MGILNVTPDSFSDGGAYLDPEDAVRRALDMAAQGADVIDIGPESTRPGSHGVPADEQIARAVPVIEAIRKFDDFTPLSIDTCLASVASAALDAGADIVNDVSAMRDDPAMADVVAEAGVPIVLMHRRGIPADMQKGGGPHYDDVTGEICQFLTERVDHAESRGIDRSRVIVDPGIGFGKRVEDNLRILNELDRLVSLGFPVLVGASRKRFIGAVKGEARPEAAPDSRSRLGGSLAAAALAARAGAAMIRVHDVVETVEMLRVLRAAEAAAR